MKAHHRAWRYVVDLARRLADELNPTGYTLPFVLMVVACHQCGAEYGADPSNDGLLFERPEDADAAASAAGWLLYGETLVTCPACRVPGGDMAVAPSAAAPSVRTGR